MRHRIAGRTLGRNAASRLALMRSLSRALIEHGRIITTVAKAKELRPFVEKLVTLAKKAHLGDDRIQALHYRRLALKWLPDKGSVAKLFNYREFLYRYPWLGRLQMRFVAEITKAYAGDGTPVRTRQLVLSGPRSPPGTLEHCIGHRPAP